MVDRLRPLLAALLLAAPLAGPAAAGEVLDRVRDGGILVGAVDATWPPYSWRDPLGEYHGFDVEVTRAIADRLDARAEFVAPGWEALVDRPWDHGWDIAVASVTPTPERQSRLAFPAVYAQGQAALAVRSDDPRVAEVADASGLRIGVLERSLYAAYLEEGGLGLPDSPPSPIVGATIVELADTAAQYRLLGEGRLVDAIIDDLEAIRAQIAQGRPIRIVGAPLFATPNAVAVDLGDPEFVAEVARIVEEMRVDGSLRAITLRWFETAPELAEAD